MPICNLLEIIDNIMLIHAWYFAHSFQKWYGGRFECFIVD